MATKEQLKRKYFSSLAVSNLNAARIQWTGEVLGKHRKEVDVWRNVAQHSLVQTAGCDVLAEELGLSESSRKNLIFAALIHDWDKKYQSLELKKINQQVEKGEIDEKEGGKRKYDFFEESESHSIEGLRKKGVPEDITKITSADGHPALPRIMKPDCSLEEKILHYVGSITDQDNIVPLNVRIDNLEFNSRYKMMNEYGRQVPWTNGRTLYEAQREVGHIIEKELVDKLLQTENLSEDWKNILTQDPTQLPLFLKRKITEKYS